MFRRVLRLSRTAAGTSQSALFISTTSAESIATSVPAPIAMPVSALVSAGASLMPSPTIAVFPRSCRRRITASLPSGRTPAITSSTDACPPTAPAVRSLSPVSITTRMPISFSSSTASLLSALSVSETAMIPSTLSPHANRSGVLPSCASACARRSMSAGTGMRELIYPRLPPRSSAPPSSSLPPTPLPGYASKSETSGSVRSLSCASCTMARPRGCSLFFSSAPASSRSRSSDTPSAHERPLTRIFPVVMVPVLSNAMICVRPVSSRAAAVLNRMPFLAPTPLPTMIATGVASPSAHGQLITSTEMALARAKAMPSPASIHAAQVTRAMQRTAGTKIPLTLSAVFAIGALVAAASDTI